jgi:hypothetical protein
MHSPVAQTRAQRDFGSKLTIYNKFHVGIICIIVVVKESHMCVCVRQWPAPDRVQVPLDLNCRSAARSGLAFDSRVSQQQIVPTTSTTALQCTLLAQSSKVALVRALQICINTKAAGTVRGYSCAARRAEKLHTKCRFIALSAFVLLFMCSGGEGAFSSCLLQQGYFS